MWAFLLVLTLLFQVSAPAHVRLVSDNVATVTNLAADVTTIPGQTIVTFTGIGAEGDGKTYTVKRYSAQITSGNIASATTVATLDQYSGRLRYNDSPGTITNGENLTTGFVVAHNGSHLPSGTGLVVLTNPSPGQTAFYAVTNSTDGAVTVGVNSLTNGVVETYQATPGAIHIGSTSIAGYTVHRYYGWRNYATWVHSEWGYYGFRFNVMVPTSGSNFPVLLQLHGGGTAGYVEPDQGGYFSAVTIRPFSPDFGSTTDPYTGGSRRPEWWLFQFDTAADLYKTSSMDRVVDYVKAVRDNAMGDGLNFSVNPNRIYVHGASGGSSGMHIAAHHPELFAAAMAGEPWLDNTAAGGGTMFPNPSKKVNSSSGDTLAHYFDLAYQATQVALPPIIHVFGAMDVTVTPTPYPAGVTAFETYHQPYMVEWTDTDHDGGHDPSYAQWDANTGAGYLRFLLNEAYPAFGTASTSNTLPATYPTHSTGQRNGTLDWHSSLHSISGGSAITDSAGTFAISLISSSQSTGTTVTIRNGQSFRPGVGAALTWAATGGQSGSATRNSDGSVTVTGLTINTTATRLTITDAGSPSASASPSPSPSASQSPSSSVSPSPSASVSPSASASRSPSPSSSVSPSVSPSSSVSPSISRSPSPSASTSPSPSPGSSSSVSPSASASISPSASVSPSPSASVSASPSRSASASVSASPSPSGPIPAADAVIQVRP